MMGAGNRPPPRGLLPHHRGDGDCIGESFSFLLDWLRRSVAVFQSEPYWASDGLRRNYYRAEPLARLCLGLAGSVLMVAALLKLAGTNVSAFAQYGWFLAPNVQIAAVGWELILGSALLLGIYRPVTWLLAMLTFALFTGVILSIRRNDTN